MKTTGFGRYGLCANAVTALLAGCGGSAFNSPIPSTPVTDTLAHHITFHYTGAKQYFTVPRGVESLTIVVLGAAGGSESGTAGGLGGRVYAVVPVTPGETLVVFVGGTGSGTAGGFNGGGNGASGYRDASSYGGGGATDVRRGGEALSDRIVVAGGGGGQGGYDFLQNKNYGWGGDGGGRIGSSGKLGWYPGESKSGGSSSWAGRGGAGGAQRHGGTGGSGGDGLTGYGQSGANGLRRHGGDGGAGCATYSSCIAGGNGGGGGGGYFGGGGGGTAGEWDSGYGAGGGGGGGGSSFAERGASHFRSWHGWKDATGNGLVVFSW